MQRALVDLKLHPALASKAVRVWHTDLDQSPDEAAVDCLSGAERLRAAHFAFSVHRQRFVAGRCFVRQVLAARLGCVPHRISLKIGERGKPAAVDCPDCHFNLAHSDATALLALAPQAIGIDVEMLQPVFDADLLAERLYTASEREWIENVAGTERIRRFLQCWTRKEACLKAIGCGLAVEPASFDVVAGFGKGPICVAWDSRNFWLSLYDLEDQQNRWVAAVALIDAERRSDGLEQRLGARLLCV